MVPAVKPAVKIIDTPEPVNVPIVLLVRAQE
jgi:hypothetical protein